MGFWPIRARAGTYLYYNKYYRKMSIFTNSVQGCCVFSHLRFTPDRWRILLLKKSSLQITQPLLLLLSLTQYLINMRLDEKNVRINLLAVFIFFCIHLQLQCVAAYHIGLTVTVGPGGGTHYNGLYTGRLRPKGVPFLGFRYMKG